MILKCLDCCTYKVFNQLALTTMSEKNISGFMEGTPPSPCGATETTFHSSWKMRNCHRKSPEMILITLAKNLFLILKSGVRNKKSSLRGYTPHKSISIFQEKRQRIYFGPRLYPIGSIVIALVSPLVRPSVSLSLNISETAHKFF